MAARDSFSFDNDARQAGRRATRRFACDYFLLRCLSDQIESRSDHYSLCLVSRSFNHAFTPGLYRELTLDPSLKHVYANNPHFRNVRSIHVWTRQKPDVLHRAMRLKSTPWRTKSLTQALQQTTTLKALRYASPHPQLSTDCPN